MIKEMITIARKHNDKEFSDTIKAHIQHTLKERQDFGLAQGTYAACKVVYDKATAGGKSAEDKLDDIIAFCRPILDMVAREAADKAAKAGD